MTTLNDDMLVLVRYPTGLTAPPILAVISSRSAGFLQLKQGPETSPRVGHLNNPSIFESFEPR